MKFGITEHEMTIFTEVVVNGTKRLVNLSPSTKSYIRPDDGAVMRATGGPGRFVSERFLSHSHSSEQAS
jgi:hypothetical protein